VGVVVEGLWVGDGVGSVDVEVVVGGVVIVVVFVVVDELVGVVLGVGVEVVLRVVVVVGVVDEAGGELTPLLVTCRRVKV